MIYFTADTHFGHSNIINLNGRPFDNLEKMTHALIQNWNACVSQNDDIYILGDFTFNSTGEQANNILRRLAGRKYIIRGNHDKFLDDPNFDTSLVEWVKDYYVLNYKKRKFVLFHYPILEWHGFFGDAIHLYGHVHNSNKNKEQKSRLNILGKRAMNVGVDVNDYFPVSIDRVMSVCKLNI